jgi:hypothetical protein
MPDGKQRRSQTLVRDSDIPGILTFVASLMAAMMALLNVMPGYRWWLLARRRSLRRCSRGGSCRDGTAD